MFSVNRFDPNNSQQLQQDSGQPVCKPLLRLNQRLEAKNLSEKRTTITTEAEKSTEPETQAEETESIAPLVTREIQIHVDRQNPREPSLEPSHAAPLTKKQKARLQLGFTGANTIPLPSLQAPKPKSSAKLKYLKRKKERKKSRKRTSTTNNAVGTRKNVKQEEPFPCFPQPDVNLELLPQQTQEDDVLSENTEPTLPDNPEPTLSEKAEPTLMENAGSEKPKRVKRPKNLDVALEKISKKKKRDRESSPAGRIDELGKNVDEEEVAQTSTSVVEQISQPGALPRFPAPTNPSLPDPQLLARLAMGLGDPDLAEVAGHDSDLDMVQFDSGSTLPLSRILVRASPPAQFIQSLSLSHQSVSRLKELEFESLLAVQIAVFSILMPPLSAYPTTPASSLYPSRRPPRDLCVSAPTGSGKTLSYIVPIVEALSSRVVCRLRALIVLPTRDLVLQVKNTFDSFAKGTGLKAAIITGQHSFPKEQALLSSSRDGLEGAVDVVIATPGRLVDHLNCTPAFSLEHLCFLVLDEADQLLNKSQAWLNQILSSAPHAAPSSESSDPRFSPSSNLPSCSLAPTSSAFPHEDRPHLRELNLPIETHNPCRLRPFRILLFSATLRRDPVKLAHLGLRRPVFVKISSSDSAPLDGDPERPARPVDFVDQLNSYSLPTTLEQYITVTRTDLKPLVFFKLVESQRIEKALCFCKSVEGARRLTALCRLMVEQFQALPSPPSLPPSVVTSDTPLDQHVGNVELCRLFKVECFSSDLSPADRKKILQKFQAGEINMLICSDMIARGMDIPGVQNVVNYDAPIDIKKYVHRVGRTARANEHGRAFSLVEAQEAKFVKGFLDSGVRGSGSLSPLVKIRIDWKDVQAFLPSYHIALKGLAQMFGRSVDL
ncbi:hypothetical protein PCANC_19363 [Puccinia coronata f. sp. avenae]|uniref:ATP-dependent RNA helicase n=1 Tax=Puccinia coronata f. sp. avenae TaxID=200324 RepID=A0A2N5SDJ1_9BASI|nr:hypothetical protein PCANC_19363 [Puccinia coronata f. sp. avenae]